MNSYFSLHPYYSKGALKLSVDYSFDDVPDPHIMNTPVKTTVGFVKSFRFAESGHIREDMLANNASWVILSERICNILKTSCSKTEVELIPLSDNPDASDRLKGYHILGVKKRIQCVDYDHSDILWSNRNPDRKHILSFRKCVIRDDAIPQDISCFLIAEYPSYPVMTSALVRIIELLHPSGLVFKPIEIVRKNSSVS